MCLSKICTLVLNLSRSGSVWCPFPNSHQQKLEPCASHLFLSRLCMRGPPKWWISLYLKDCQLQNHIYPYGFRLVSRWGSQKCVTRKQPQKANTSNRLVALRVALSPEHTNMIICLPCCFPNNDSLQRKQRPMFLSSSLNNKQIIPPTPLALFKG